jgi:hypothetical protein
MGPCLIFASKTGVCQSGARILLVFPDNGANALAYFAPSPATK